MKDIWRWYPLSKGGEFRKWYGNSQHVINLWRNGYSIQNGGGNFRLRDPKWYFKESISWSELVVPQSLLGGYQKVSYFLMLAQEFSLKRNVQTVLAF